MRESEIASLKMFRSHSPLKAIRWQRQHIQKGFWAFSFPSLWGMLAEETVRACPTVVAHHLLLLIALAPQADASVLCRFHRVYDKL